MLQTPPNIKARPSDEPAAPSSRTDIEGWGGQTFEAMDRMRDAWVGQLSGGISPASLGLALMDWLVHVHAAPGKRLELGLKAQRKVARLLSYLFASAADPQAPRAIEPLPDDMRFSDPKWQSWPYSFWSQAFLLQQQWWHNATHDVPGVEPHHQDVVSFATRQILDIFSPSNLPFANPAVIERTLKTGGMNFVSGWQNFLEDVSRKAAGALPAGAEAFKVGLDVAATPGTVVYRNRLIELIRYAPATQSVLREPVLIVPAWIMKYYILDLSPRNSLIRFLVERGHTVYCISWRNPDESDRDTSFDDYRRLGVMAAIEEISRGQPHEKIHAAGYCLGGTLLSIAAAAMAEVGDERLASVTLLAAQTDFTEPGELALFIDRSQLHLLEGMMWNRGYLSADQMAGAFQLLRSNDLVWSRIVHEYLMGERAELNDLMAWNADSTRMPYRMHSEYLEKLYLGNELAAGRFVVDGQPIAVQNIASPIFVVGTERDHVAPWKSVFKIHYLSRSEITFVLTSGGHNAGIVSEPGHPHRHFRMATRKSGEVLKSAEEWLDAVSPREGSWWEEWTNWLAAHSSPDRVAPPPFAADLGPAPGHYVMQK